MLNQNTSPLPRSGYSSGITGYQSVFYHSRSNLRICYYQRLSQDLTIPQPLYNCRGVKFWSRSVSHLAVSDRGEKRDYELGCA